MKKTNITNISKVGSFLLLTMALSFPLISIGQDGTNGINTATSEISKYVSPVSNLILGLGGLIGFVGGIRVYIRWNNGGHEIQEEIMGWAGACIFLVLVSVVLKAFFE